MGDKSKIEWTDATWNPVSGCTKVSQGCKNCYAERVFPRAYATSARLGREFTDVRCHPVRLNQPVRWKRPRKIFVNSMSDLFHEAVPDEFIWDIFDVMFRTHQHTYQILTKRADRMLKFCSSERAFAKPLPNVWLGVSVEDQETADERIPLLLQTPAAVRFVSYEPALGPVDFRLTPNPSPLTPSLDWVICGGESGPHARPMHPDWARSVRDQCQAAGVPFFFKQWGEWAEVCRRTDGNCVGKYVLEAGDVILRSHGPIERVAQGGIWERVGGMPMRRVGKKNAGALLDGREWKEFPCSET